MRTFLMSIMFAMAASPVLAAVATPNVFRPVAAPAPLIGAGIPVALVVGGALLVSRFVKKRK
jgi:hypothetical protein